MVCFLKFAKSPFVNKNLVSLLKFTPFDIKFDTRINLPVLNWNNVEFLLIIVICW
jgi:hypothetical protein